MEVKKSLKINAPATMLKFNFNPFDTAEDVYHEMNNKITEYQNTEDEQAGFDKIARILTYLPRIIYKLIVNIMIWQDNNRILPEVIRKASPGHCSMLITSMASLGIPSIFHHLYDFGNCPIFISFSTSRHAYEMNKDGIVEKKHYLDINYTLDDRICDGVYYAAGMRSIRRHLKNPHLLDVPPSQVVVDVE